MRGIGNFFLLAGLIIGFAATIQLESLRITMATKIAQESIESDTSTKIDAVKLARKITVKTNEVSRILYFPFFIIFIGSVFLAFSQRRTLNQK